MAIISQSVRPKVGARLLGISLPTFQRWRNVHADFPRPRVLSARCTVFDRDELLAWRDSRAQGGAK